MFVPLPVPFVFQRTASDFSAWRLKSSLAPRSSPGKTLSPVLSPPLCTYTKNKPPYYIQLNLLLINRFRHNYTQNTLFSCLTFISHLTNNPINLFVKDQIMWLHVHNLILFIFYLIHSMQVTTSIFPYLKVILQLQDKLLKESLNVISLRKKICPCV